MARAPKRSTGKKLDGSPTSSNAGNVNQPAHESQLALNEEGYGDGGILPPDTTGMVRVVTPQERAFCFIYLETNDKKEAYLQAYNADRKQKHASRRGQEVYKRPQVQRFLQTLYDNQQEKFDITIERLTRNLLEDRQLAYDCEDAKAAIAADMGLAKLHGLLIPQKKKDNEESMAELIREARERISGPKPKEKVIEGEATIVSNS